MILGKCTQDWGWKPSRFFNCWKSHLSFMQDLEDFWKESCELFPGHFSLSRKISYLAKTFWHWNKIVNGNQDTKLADIQSGLKALELEGENRVLTQSEPSMLQNVVSDQRSVRKNIEAIWRQKSRQTWCRLEDKTLSFFTLLQTSDGLGSPLLRLNIKVPHFFTPIDIKEAIVSFYSELFTTPVAKRPYLGGMRFKKLSPTWKPLLSRPRNRLAEYVWLKMYYTPG